MRPLDEAPFAAIAAPPRRDPAPSRIAYRLRRLWLTPLFRAALARGVPAAAVALGVVWWFQDAGRREMLTDQVEAVRLSIAQRPEFQVQALAIEGASAPLDAAIRTAVALRFPLSSFELDLGAMQKTVAALDAVASAEVRVRRGGILEIRVSERLPAVVWRTDSGVGLLDAEGRTVAPLLARLERPDLPLIVGLGADRAVPEALALFAVAGPLAPRMRGLVRVGERRWDVVVAPDIRLMLPETDAVRAFERIIALDAAQNLLSRDVAVVDLRIPSRPTLRLNPMAAEAVRMTRTHPGVTRR